MKMLGTILRIILGVFAAHLPSAFAQGGSESAYDIVQQDGFAKAFHSGNTNTPLLVMDWFSGSRIDEFCRVSRAGKVSSARNVINWAIQGGHWADLDQTNLESLVTTINALPPPPKVTPPQERWLVVQGIRTNQWFKYIFDRANVPKEVEKLYQITGAYLEWFIPNVEGDLVLSNSSIGEFYIARHAPQAILFDSTNILCFDLKDKTVRETVPINLIPLRQAYQYYRAVAISPDGKILVKSVPGDYNDFGVCGIDLTTKKVLWKKDSLDHQGIDLSKVIIGDDKGQFLFACGAHTIERWDLTTGKCLAVLATNQPLIKYVEVSQDGKIFMAGFDNSTQDLTKSLTIWRASENQPAAHLETGPTSACLSPDGRTLALNRFGKRLIELIDWEHSSTTEVPLRVPYASVWASKMFWSPNGTRFAAHLFGSTDSIVIYETTTWKPLAHLPNASSSFDQNDQFLQLRNGGIYSLDTTVLKSLGD